MAITSAFQADDAGSIPAARSKFGSLAQSVEQLTVNQLVAGSSPARTANSRLQYWRDIEV